MVYKRMKELEGPVCIGPPYQAKISAFAGVDLMTKSY